MIRRFDGVFKSYRKIKDPFIYNLIILNKPKFQKLLISYNIYFIISSFKNKYAVKTINDMSELYTKLNLLVLKIKGWR